MAVGAIVAGIAAIIAAGVTAGGAASASAEEEKALKKKMRIGAQRFDRQQDEVERQNNLGTLQRLKITRDIAKTATGDAWGGPSKPKTRGENSSGAKTSSGGSTSPTGSIVSGVTQLAGAGVSAVGASQQAREDAKIAEDLSNMEQSQFDREQKERERMGNQNVLDFLTISRYEEKDRSNTKKFNNDLYQAMLNKKQGVT